MSSLSFLFLLLLCCSTSSNVSAASAKSRPEIIKARNGVVAADDGRCSDTGRDILREGGNAIDASIATSLCLGVVNPASSGIGGGALMLLRMANGTVKAFDMRERAPLLASEDMYKGNRSLKASGPLSIATPGELAGFYEVWKKYGRLPWKRLVEPAEHFARHGFEISPDVHMQLTQLESAVKADPGLSKIFAPNGKLLQAGEICRNKRLAETLKQISIHGVQPLYNGTIGLNLVRDIQRAGGILKMEDLQNYQVVMRKPLNLEVMGLKVFGMPPPSSGGASMALILNILAQYGFSPNISTPLQVHRQIEALKHAFAVRMNLGDSDFVNVTGVLSDMLSPRFAAELRKTINDNMTFNSTYYGGRWNQIRDRGTSHLSVIDQDRNAVALTCTINYHFGSHFLSPSTGIVLNNQMDDFSIPTNATTDDIPPPDDFSFDGNTTTSVPVPPPSPANFIRPLKRPLSSMSPTIILKDGNLRAVVGGSGGPRIIPATTEVFLNYFARGMDPLSSVFAPRYYHRLIPNYVEYENWTTVINDHIELDKEIRVELQKKGHILHSLPNGAIVQFAIQELEASNFGELVAVSDPRKGGIPAGF